MRMRCRIMHARKAGGRRRACCALCRIALCVAPLPPAASDHRLITCCMSTLAAGAARAMAAPVSRVLVVGGVAGGASCAARLRRLSEQVAITVFEKGARLAPRQRMFWFPRSACPTRLPECRFGATEPLGIERARAGSRFTSGTAAAAATAAACSAARAACCPSRLRCQAHTSPLPTAACPTTWAGSSRCAGVCSTTHRVRCRRAALPGPRPPSAPPSCLQEESSLLVANAAKFEHWFNVEVQENTEVGGATAGAGGSSHNCRMHAAAGNHQQH